MATFKDRDGDDIELELFQPPSSGIHPCVVLAYGTRGLTDPFGKDIRKFASALAANDFVVAIPHYFDSTQTSASTSLEGDVVITGLFVNNGDKWIDTVRRCVSHVATLSEVDGDHIGVLGFSMGGHIALRLGKLAASLNVKAVVDFFAPVTQSPFVIGGEIDKLPPVQIHHGEDDGPPVSPDQSRKLEQLLKAEGKVKDSDYEIYFYPGEGHGFKSPAAIDKSTDRTIAFFRKHLV